MATPTVYLIHFWAPLGNTNNPRAQATHYLGYTGNLSYRLYQHQSGNGCAIMAAVKRAGISWSLARVWQADRKLERRLKEYKNLKRFCPICNSATAAKEIRPYTRRQP